MDTIIVTVTDEMGSFFLDMELPMEQSIDSLIFDIISTICSYNNTLQIPEGEIFIFSNRTRKVLKDNETLRSAGVWNGDYITLVSGGR